MQAPFGPRRESPGGGAEAEAGRGVEDGLREGLRRADRAPVVAQSPGRDRAACTTASTARRESDSQSDPRRQGTSAENGIRHRRPSRTPHGMSRSTSSGRAAATRAAHRAPAARRIGPVAVEVPAGELVTRARVHAGGATGAALHVAVVAACRESCSIVRQRPDRIVLAGEHDHPVERRRGRAATRSSAAASPAASRQPHMTAVAGRTSCTPPRAPSAASSSRDRRSSWWITTGGGRAAGAQARASRSTWCGSACDVTRYATPVAAVAVSGRLPRRARRRRRRPRAPAPGRRRSSRRTRPSCARRRA